MLSWFAVRFEIGRFGPVGRRWEILRWSKLTFNFLLFSISMHPKIHNLSQWLNASMTYLMSKTKPCRPCINFYIKSFSASINTVAICLWKWMVECYTAPRFIHLIANINRWRGPKCKRNLAYIMNDSEKNIWIFVWIYGFFINKAVRNISYICVIQNILVSMHQD